MHQELPTRKVLAYSVRRLWPAGICSRRLATVAACRAVGQRGVKWADLRFLGPTCGAMGWHEEARVDIRSLGLTWSTMNQHEAQLVAADQLTFTEMSACIKDTHGDAALGHSTSTCVTSRHSTLLRAVYVILCYFVTFYFIWGCCINLHVCEPFHNTKHHFASPYITACHNTFFCITLRSFA